MKIYHLITIIFFSSLLIKIDTTANSSNSITNSRYKNLDDHINDYEAFFQLTNAQNMRVTITNYGGRIVSIIVPNGRDIETDIVLGCDSIIGYKQKSAAFFGAIIGRFANRIKNAQFTIDNQVYQLPVNNGKHCLHSGPNGFHHQLWKVERRTANSIVLSYLSEDGEAGFPGNLTVQVEYTLTNNNELSIMYQAQTDKKTVINLTNHTFFNLNGQGVDSIVNHHLQINAAQFTAVNADRIPTGDLIDVHQTAFDFRQPKPISHNINDNDIQLTYANGYDHNFVLDKNEKGRIREAAMIYSPKSGIKMTVSTTEPGIQFYSGNFLDGTVKGKLGTTYGSRSGFCLETQHFPDSPNQPNFPSTILEPNKKFMSSTVYAFSW